MGNLNRKKGKPRGFAVMDPDEQRHIASLGGKAAHRCGRAHEYTSEEAREAGRKGGLSVSRDRSHMAAIGRRGGLSNNRPRTYVRLRQCLVCEGMPPRRKEFKSGSDWRQAKATFIRNHERCRQQIASAIGRAKAS